jgi:hypothetical protein
MQASINESESASIISYDNECKSESNDQGDREANPTMSEFVDLCPSNILRIMVSAIDVKHNVIYLDHLPYQPAEPSYPPPKIC